MTSRNDGLPVMAPAESLPGRRRLMGVVAIVMGCASLLVALLPLLLTLV